MQSQATSSQNPISKNPSQKRAGGMAQCVATEFKHQYHKNKTKQNKTNNLMILNNREKGRGSDRSGGKGPGIEKLLFKQRLEGGKGVSHGDV
jgi:hypothetical protein